MNSLVFLVGATAVGKTELAFQLAQNTKSSIINSDSIQAYKDLNIGSSKPDFTKYPDVPCFLFDIVSAPHVWTAGDFRKKSLEVLHQEIPKRSVFIVGGSGFYIQALEKGMYDLKPIPQSIKKEIEILNRDKGLDFLYQELKLKDAKLAENISPKDSYRIIRSLCIIRNENKSLSQIKKEFTPFKLPWKYKKIGLSISKQELLKKVEERTRHMLARGLIEEVEELVKKGLEDWKPLQSVGYREVSLYLRGILDKENLFQEIVKNTMLLAKKQKTWFQKDEDIKWYDFTEDLSKIQKHLF